MSAAIEEKKKLVEEIKAKIEKAGSLVLVDYKGITVKQDTELRAKFRASGVEYRVLKNRLVKLAFNELGKTDFDQHLEGTTAIAFGYEDVMAPAKIAAEAGDQKMLSIKCGMLEDKFLDADAVKAVAKIPAKEILIAQLLGLLKEPIARFARVMSAIAEKQEQA